MHPFADIETDIRNALIQAIITRPNATIADLLALVRGESGSILRGVTLGELADATGLPRAAKRGPRQAKPAKATRSSKSSPNTRTAEGRAAYDDAMLRALDEVGGGPVRSADLIAKVGGTTLQARASLNRLIEAGKVTFTGKARGTRYSLTK